MSQLVLSGRSALITGATSGIGEAYAETLAERGHNLVLVARSADQLESLAARLRRSGVTVEVLAADLAERDQLDTVAERVAGTGPAGPVDLLLNNAGFGVGEPFRTSDLAVQQNMVDVMVTAVMVLSHAAANAMVDRRHGFIQNVASVAAFFPNGTYAAAKAWVSTFTMGLDAELEGTGVQANALCPGMVRTGFQDRAGMQDVKAPSWVWLDVDDVVTEGLQALEKGRSISVTSHRYGAMVAITRRLPLRAQRAIAGRMG